MQGEREGVGLINECGDTWGRGTIQLYAQTPTDRQTVQTLSDRQTGCWINYTRRYQRIASGSCLKVMWIRVCVYVCVWTTRDFVAFIHTCSAGSAVIYLQKIVLCGACVYTCVRLCGDRCKDSKRQVRSVVDIYLNLQHCHRAMSLANNNNNNNNLFYSTVYMFVVSYTDCDASFKLS